MRSTLVAAVLALAWAGAAEAQQPAGPIGGRGLFTGISLTADQQRRIDSIWAAHQPVRDAMRSTRQPGQGMDPGRIEQRAAMQTGMRNAYRAVLTPEQQQAFDHNVERMRQRQGPRRGAGAGGPPTDG